MAQEKPVGQVFHTPDGKTVFIDPKTNQASVFEGILSIDKIVEPATEIGIPQSGKSGEAFEALKNLLPPGLLKLDFLVITGGLPKEKNEDIPDILGEKEFYVLAPKSAVPLSIGSCPIRAWVSEFKSGHHPDYQGYIKHRILHEQWDWLHNHKECLVRAWYDQECPAFISLACQSHSKVIRPIYKHESTIGSSTEPVMLDLGTVETTQDSVLTEERDI